MKTLIIFTICLFSLATVFGQKQNNIEIPTTVKTSFASKFPKIKDAKWEMEKKGVYEAEFKMNGVETSALYDEKGNLLETEIEIKEIELPQGVRTAMSKDFQGYKLSEFNKLTNSKGSVTYGIEGKKEKEMMEATYDTKGKLLNKETKENNEKEDND